MLTSQCDDDLLITSARVVHCFIRRLRHEPPQHSYTVTPALSMCRAMLLGTDMII